MSYLLIESPGVGTGPCLKCDHIDCAESRAAVRVRCAICGKQIGYDTKFFRDGDRTTHFVCRVKEISNSRK